MTTGLPTHADPTMVAWSSPLGRPVHFLLLEVAFLACFALTLRHAAARYRAGERYHLFQWLVILFYGIAMELVAFNFYQNYDHAQFTVQLYHRKLPLYINCVYLVFHYTGLKAVERLRLSWWKEALLVGFAICMLDVPFDTLGVDARWWIWSPTDLDVGYRWLGVPVTSYYWYMLFGGILAALCRGLRARIEARPIAAYVAAAPLVALLVIVLGVLGFLPFHALVALGIPDGVVVGAHMALCLALAVSLRAELAERPAFETWAATLALGGLYVVAMAMLWASGGLSSAAPKALAIVAATAISAVLTWAVPLRRRGPAVAPALAKP